MSKLTRQGFAPDSPEPSPVAAAIGMDVGGGALKAGVAVVDAAGRLHRAETAPTPAPLPPAIVFDHHAADDPAALERSCAHTAQGLFRQVRRVLPAVPVRWGVATAVWIDPQTGTGRFSPHLPVWIGRTLPYSLAAALGSAGPWSARPVVVNDADAAAWAETHLGASDPTTRTVLVSIGTGIGGALVRDGVVDTGAHGMAGEYGHMGVDPQGRPCPCGNTGCWELLVSGPALARRAGHGSARQVIDAALDGEARCITAVTETGSWLGRGLAVLAAALDPEVFVIGGGVLAAGELLLEPARTELERRLPGRDHRPVPPVLPAVLGNDAGWLGAAGLALERAGRRPLTG